MKEKKMSKKELNEMILKFRKDTLEGTKERYNTYLEAIVDYDEGDLALCTMNAKKMFQESCTQKLEYCLKNKKSFSQHVLGYGTKPLTEIERVESDIKYYEKLIESAKLKIGNFTKKTRIKMADDSIKYFSMYMNNITDELKEKNESKSKVKK